MIRKLARVEAPLDALMAVFRDTDAWPRWMPGVTSTRTLDTTAEHRLIEVVHLVLGRRMVQHLECREQDGRMLYEQVTGWFRKWEATWTFQSPPEGEGTIVSMNLEIDAGMAGLIMPRKLLSGWIQNLVDDTIDRGRERAQSIARQSREPPPAAETGQPVLEVYETAEGFEVHFAGRTFHIETKELSET